MSVLIYGRDTSYNVQKVLWLMEELNIKYSHTQLGGKFGGTETEEFESLNPCKKVPVIVDGKNVVWESNTILRYLANSYGAGTWKESDAYKVSQFERWMDWSQTKFEPAFVGVFWGYYRTPEHLQNKSEINKSIKSCTDCLSKLDEQLKNQKYLLGEKISLADITTGVFIYRLVGIGLSIELPNNVNGWYNQLQNSNGYQQWVMSDFSELKGRLEY
ncbi:MAG: glutathione S-transferase [Cycloclasticus sp. symbiont of Bathymodiolus heckerae]|nr:MAG: glutathione S-transferase [Cycloclasticus sp. symbiont of Bathymodiolus heckerae]